MPVISIEDVQTRLKQVENQTDLPEAAKTKAIEHLKQAVQEFELAATWASKVARHAATVHAAPADIADVKAELASPRLKIDDQSQLGTSTLQQLEQLLAQRESDLTASKRKLADLEDKPKRRAVRRLEIPKLVASAKERLAETEQQLRAPSAPEENSALVQARRTLLLARHYAAKQEIASYEAEAAMYDATAELMPVQRDLEARRVSAGEEDIKELREYINNRRQAETRQQAQRVRAEANQKVPALKQLADRNAGLIDRRKFLNQKIETATRDLAHVREELAQIQDQKKRTIGKVDAVGLTNAVGLLLRKQRGSLNDVAVYRRRVKARQDDISAAQFELLELEDQRSARADLETQLRRVVEQVDLPPGDLLEAEIAARGLLETERSFLDSLIADLSKFFDTLVELDSVEQQLIEETDEFQTYIDERVLWIRSAAGLDVDDLAAAPAQAAWFLDPSCWSDVCSLMLGDARQHTAVYAGLLFLVVPILFLGSRLRRIVDTRGEVADRANCVSFKPTVTALAATGLLSMIMPGLLALLAWRLGTLADTDEFAVAVSTGLLTVASLFLPCEFLRRACVSNGLAEAHFDWPESGLRVLRWNLHWLMVAGLPLTFVSSALEAQDNERLIASLGRLAFIGVMLLAAAFMQRVLRPKGGVLQEMIAYKPGGWLDRLRYIFYPLGMLAPLALVTMSVLGYQFTAARLAVRMQATIWLALVMLLLGGLLLRWLKLSRRRLAIDQRRQNAAESQEAQAAASGPKALGSNNTPAVDLASINTQTKQLLQSLVALAACLGIWMIWVDVLPALSMLNEVELWHTFVTVAEGVPGEGATTTRVERYQAITLADVALAIIVCSMTWIGSRNIPGLVEMLLLKRLPLEASVRYAFSTVSQYVITTLGILFAAGALGLGWNKVQWLVAAISVGLGFGLQEIFANFVSGLIILFERPIRVGDVVTIGDISGVVSRIRIRATTITSWERKELVVPNKEFITGRLLNWTLSDAVNRVVINVGIAYGSDVDLARNILTKVATDNALVLSDPAPLVTFEGFGDSALLFVLRAYLPNLDQRLAVIDQLHTGIDRAFRESGIEIAFPQQDLHIRNIAAPLNLHGAIEQAGTSDGRTWHLSPPASGVPAPNLDLKATQESIVRPENS